MLSEKACLQEMMAEALAELEVHNISTAPKFGISLSTLEEAAMSEEACTRLYDQMKEAVGESDPAPLVQPALSVAASCDAASQSSHAALIKRNTGVTPVRI